MLALCPHCLEHRDLQEVHDLAHGLVLRCDNPRCEDPTVPHLYGEDYAEHLPVPISFVGLSGHGKSVFLESLLQEIDSVGQRWADSGFRSTWLDQVQFRNTSRRIRALRDGPPVGGDRSIFQQPQILRLHGIPRIGGCQLVITDTAGEAFLEPKPSVDAARYVSHSTAVVLLLSLKRGDPYGTPAVLNQMMATYLETIDRMGGRTQDQNLVLALTKGDELLHRLDLPESARQALDEVDYCPGGSIWATLERSSSDLEGWLGSVHCGYHKFVELVRSQFRAVRYCVTSAQGTPLESSAMHMAMMPRGVLAPLLWLWRLNRDPIWTERNGVKELYLDLAEAVANASDGTVQLEDRTYRLASPLNVTRPVTIVGQGSDTTSLQVTAPGYGIGIRTTGKVTLRGLNISRPPDSSPGDLIRVLGGELDLREVELSGGLSGEVAHKPVGGGGVLAGNQSRLTATSCSFRNNHGNGVLVNERAAAELTSCVFENNGNAGVYSRTAGSLTVTHGGFRENHTGIWVEGAASASISSNICERNTECGLVLSGHIGGSVVVRGNTCAGNGRDGVHTRTAAAPTVVGNTCTANRRNGIAFTDQSAGTARDNNCTFNGRHGLRICDEAAPTLEENIAEGNTECGILFEEQSSGIGRENRCRDNRGDGIRVAGGATPVLAENELKLNDGYGIAIAEPTSKADVDPKANTTEGNRHGPLSDPRPKKSGSWWAWASYRGARPDPDQNPKANHLPVDDSPTDR